MRHRYVRDESWSVGASRRICEFTGGFSAGGITHERDILRYNFNAIPVSVRRGLLCRTAEIRVTRAQTRKDTSLMQITLYHVTPPKRSLAFRLTSCNLKRDFVTFRRNYRINKQSCFAFYAAMGVVFLKI